MSITKNKKSCLKWFKNYLYEKQKKETYEEKNIRIAWSISLYSGVFYFLIDSMSYLLEINLFTRAIYFFCFLGIMFLLGFAILNKFKIKIKFCISLILILIFVFSLWFYPPNDYVLKNENTEEPYKLLYETENQNLTEENQELKYNYDKFYRCVSDSILNNESSKICLNLSSYN
jgi:hypothetical protein